MLSELYTKAHKTIIDRVFVTFTVFMLGCPLKALQRPGMMPMKFQVCKSCIFLVFNQNICLLIITIISILMF